MPLAAVLLRQHSVRMRNVSRTGCLLETARLLPPGTVGELQIDVGGSTRVESFRVCRSHQLAGAGGMCVAGIEFLPVTSPGRDSLRAFIAHLDGGGVSGDNGTSIGTMSAGLQTTALVARSFDPRGSGGGL